MPYLDIGELEAVQIRKYTADLSGLIKAKYLGKFEIWKEKKMALHIFIIGSKGIPGLYGGYETFVDKLTEYHQNCREIKYHVACKSTEGGEFEYHNARCFKIKVPNIGAAQAIYYDVAALTQCCKYIKMKTIEHPVIYVLACRIGPFAAHFQKKIHRLGKNFM